MRARRQPDRRLPALDEAVRASSFIFAGVVTAEGRSNVRVVEARPGICLVRVDRPIRVDPALGDVQGRMVTLDARDEEGLSIGTEAVFLTQSWIHGDELAVREIAHVGIEQADEVARAVERLPTMHLAERIAAADVVLQAEVEGTRKLTNLPLERRAPEWAEATLRIESTLMGRTRGLRLLFPTSTSHHWYRAPRLRRGQRRIFILRANDPQAARWLRDVPDGGRIFTALDPADVQPESEAARIRTLIRASRA